MKNLLSKKTLLKPLKHPFSNQTNLLINGKFVPSISNQTFPTYNPATGEEITQIQKATSEDVHLACQSAHTAFNNPSWRRTSPQQRAELLMSLADLLEKNRCELATLESLDNGKPKKVADEIDIQLAIEQFRYYAGYADKVYGETLCPNGDFHAYTRKEPVGVVGQIIPWNFPILMMAWKLAPAIAAGCTVVLKPAEQTSLTALRIGELILEAGFPDGVVNIVPGMGQEAGSAICQSRLVDKIAFTGSTQIGFEIMKNSHEENLKRITLELGGKSPHIIMDDADLDSAVFWANLGLFFNMGQCCIAGSRVFVHEKIYDDFLEKAVEMSKNVKMGDPLLEDTTQGPQISEL